MIRLGARIQLRRHQFSEVNGNIMPHVTTIVQCGNIRAVAHWTEPDLAGPHFFARAGSTGYQPPGFAEAILIHSN
jgi:hypothetical protein